MGVATKVEAATGAATKVGAAATGAATKVGAVEDGVVKDGTMVDGVEAAATGATGVRRYPRVGQL
jgi:hypothetical protein